MGANGTSTIMVVDDTPANLKLLDEMLRRCGYDVRAFPSGELALKAARNAPPHLVLLDISMPGMNGFEVCAHFKADPVLRDVPIIFISALSETQDKLKAFSAGGVDYVTKPFQFEEVKARVDTHLGLRKLRRDLELRVQEITRKNNEINQQLKQAEKVQRALLPSEVPSFEHVDFYWRYEPCDLLAGDSLHVLPLSDRFVALYLFDVTGHGVPAALLAVSVSRALQPGAGTAKLLIGQDAGPAGLVPRSPVKVAEQLNKQFPWDPESGQFITMIYGILDTYTLEYRYINAGHFPPIYITPQGAVFQQQGKGSPIGLGSGGYKEQLIQMEPGGRLVLFSDGITEVMNEKRELWGMDRFQEILRNNLNRPLGETLDDVIRETSLWATSSEILDDRTVLGVQVKKKLRHDSAITGA